MGQQHRKALANGTNMMFCVCVWQSNLQIKNPCQVEMPVCVGAKAVWRSSATGWTPVEGAKFCDGRVVVALDHFCDVVVTGYCQLKAIGFIDPRDTTAKVVLLHVACRSCQNNLDQLCLDAEMLELFKKCGPSAPLGTYGHQERLQARQAGQEVLNMPVMFHRMPQVSGKLTAQSARHFSVEIDGTEHRFEELLSEAVTASPTSQLRSTPASEVRCLGCGRCMMCKYKRRNSAHIFICRQ